MTIIAAESNSETKFQLVDGSSVDDKCSFDGTQGSCNVVVVKDGVTANSAFQTQLPPGFVPFGEAQPSELTSLMLPDSKTYVEYLSVQASQRPGRLLQGSPRSLPRLRSRVLPSLHNRLRPMVRLRRTAR